MDSTRRCLLILGTATALGAVARRAAAGVAAAGSERAPSLPALRVGLAPFLSPQALLGAFAPVRDHMARSLGQPVELYTARDFRSLHDSARRGDYDIAMLPAHMAALLATEDGWIPLASTTPLSDVLVLVRSDAPIRQPADLRGRPMGMLEPLSLSATVGSVWLQRQAWHSADMAPTVMASINSALLALLRGEVGAVVAAETQLASLPAALVAQTRVLARLERIPGPIYMARAGTPAAEHRRWLAAMTGFRPDPARPTTASNVRLTPLGAADLHPLAPYAELLRQRLAAPR